MGIWRPRGSSAEDAPMLPPNEYPLPAEPQGRGMLRRTPPLLTLKMWRPLSFNPCEAHLGSSLILLGHFTLRLLTRLLLPRMSLATSPPAGQLGLFIRTMQATYLSANLTVVYQVFTAQQMWGQSKLRNIILILIKSF